MRYEVLWSLPVALFVCGLLLSSLGPPARAGDFNPQPEPPAEMKPDLNQPVPEEGIDPGAGKKLVHPPEKKGISPGNDKPHGLEEKGISPGNDKPHVGETGPGPVPPGGKKAAHPPEKGPEPGLVHPPEKKMGIPPSIDKPHAPEVRSGPMPPRGKKATEPIDKKTIDPGDDERTIDPGDDGHAVHPAEEDVASPRDDQPSPREPLMKKDIGDGGIPSDTLLY